MEKGDGVILPREVSKGILSVYDEDGCLICVDGVVERFDGDCAWVRVMLEGRLGIEVMSMLVMVKVAKLKRVEGVSVWSQRMARVNAAKRKGRRYGEQPYWVN